MAEPVILPKRKRSNAASAAWKKRNPEKCQAHCKRHRAKYPEIYESEEYKEKNRKRQREWYLRNKEVLKPILAARSKARYELFPEKVLASTDRWRKNNPNKACSYSAKVRAKRRKAEGHHTTDDILAIFAAQNGKCAYCRKSIKKGHHVDHVIPLSKGGSNWPNNLQLTCGPCNRKKGAKLPDEFARKLGLLL